MDRVLADDLPALHSLVNGMKRDPDAVTAGLSMHWSSGQVEGHVTRAELLSKRDAVIFDGGLGPAPVS